MPKTLKTIFEEIKDDLKGSVAAQLRLQKLNAIEKGVPPAVRGVYFAILAFLGLTTLLFLLITAGFALGIPFAQGGEAYFTVRGITLGFLILSGIFVLIDLLLFLLKEPICNAIQTSIITGQLDAMDEEEQKEAAETPEPSDTLLVSGDTADVYAVDPRDLSEEKI